MSRRNDRVDHAYPAGVVGEEFAENPNVHKGENDKGRKTVLKKHVWVGIVVGRDFGRRRRGFVTEDRGLNGAGLILSVIGAVTALLAYRAINRRQLPR